jgi:hypothetical protein
MAHSRPVGGLPWVRAAIYGFGDQKEFSNDFWFNVTAGTLDPAVDGLVTAGAIYDYLGPLIRAVMSEEHLHRGINCEINNGSYTVGTDKYADIFGTQEAAAIPFDDSVVVQKICGLAGKANRGRWYFTGIADTFVTGSYINDSGVASFQALAEGCHTPITVTASGGAATLTPAHLNRQTGALHAILSSPWIRLVGTKRSRRGPF